ncbi:MAG: lactoylglutathione lyase [Nocardioidaceae bacterium]|jgi:lactoylglutathione lyase|nr:lactoylglutathione lyase [Nocardioidaceae bacterium]
MRTLHLGLRIAEPERSIAFYTSLGYEVLGVVPATELGTLTMLKLPGDEFVTLELVHDPTASHLEPGGLSHLVVQVEDVHVTVDQLSARGVQADEPASPDGSDDFWTTWITDPDGYRIELVQWPRGHPDGMTGSDLPSRDVQPTTESSRLSTRAVVAELFRRQQAADLAVLDELVATDMVNHAAGPQGREGLRQILQTIEADLGPTELEQHHLVTEGDLAVQHVTLHGTHRGSSMPLLADLPVTGEPAAWDFIHIWRVADGMVVEHWACRDDLGMIERLRGR